MPNVSDLQISLFKEEDVDFIMKYMPQLEFLNNLPVERGPSQKYSSIAEHESKSTTPMVPDEFDEYVYFADKYQLENILTSLPHTQSEVT